MFIGQERGSGVEKDKLTGDEGWMVMGVVECEGGLTMVRLKVKV